MVALVCTWWLGSAQDALVYRQPGLLRERPHLLCQWVGRRRRAGGDALSHICQTVL